MSPNDEGTFRSGTTEEIVSVLETQYVKQWIKSETSTPSVLDNNFQVVLRRKFHRFLHIAYRCRVYTDDWDTSLLAGSSRRVVEMAARRHPVRRFPVGAHHRARLVRPPDAVVESVMHHLALIFIESRRKAWLTDGSDIDERVREATRQGRKGALRRPAGVVGGTFATRGATKVTSGGRCSEEGGDQKTCKEWSGDHLGQLTRWWNVKKIAEKDEGGITFNAPKSAAYLSLFFVDRRNVGLVRAGPQNAKCTAPCLTKSFPSSKAQMRIPLRFQEHRFFLNENARVCAAAVQA